MTGPRWRTRQVSKRVYGHCALAIVCMLVTFGSQRLFLRQPITTITGKLQQLPIQVGSWVGTESTLDTETITTLGLDDWLLRYYRQDTGEVLWLYMGVFAQTSIGGHHSPQICYPASGWRILGQDTHTMPLSEGHRITLNKLIVEKDLTRQLVLYWYQWGTHVLLDTDRQRLSGEYRFKLQQLWRFITAARHDRALVRVSTPIVDSTEATLTRTMAFLHTLFPRLTQLFALEVPTP